MYKFRCQHSRRSTKASLISTNKITNIQNQLDETNNNYLALQADNKFLRDRINSLETYSRRNNFLFHGIEEKRNETERDCGAAIRRVLNIIVPDAVNHVYIIRCHRKGRTRLDKRAQSYASLIPKTGNTSGTIKRM